MMSETRILARPDDLGLFTAIDFGCRFRSKNLALGGVKLVGGATEGVWWWWSCSSCSW